jgi:isoleucyl-tRNA synthetase
MFEAKQGESFPKKEEQVLEFWKKNNIFDKSLLKTKGKKLFSFYDGPPFATGLPHYGHLLAGTIKDVIPRYKTMKGFYVPRRFGWDCHGLPVENEIEKAKELSGTEYINKYGIAHFNDECCQIVLRYTGEWKKTVERFGRWVDFDHTYKTMDLTFMESIWWVFKRLFDEDLVYEGYKVMPFSAKLGTPLSNFEANLNYKEVDDPSLTVIFPVEGEDNTFFLAWTTTPWTLVSNLALTVNPNIEYVKIKDNKTSKFYILAKARLLEYFKEGFEILDTFTGDKLKNKSYIPLFDYFLDKKNEGAFRVITDEFVSTEDGTGIVHTAPAFGEMDFYVCKAENIDPVCPIDNNGKFTEEIPEYVSMLVKDADKPIIRRLKEEGKVFHHGQIRHRYPFCWRSDTPLIYKAVRTWFVAVEKIKDKIIKANEKIHWVPDHIKMGRFGKWLENARDWAISRNRFWGTPIPLWRSESGKICVIGSLEELEEKTGKKLTNIHRQYVDDLTFEIDGEKYSRIPEVFDCWFESGSMPYAQNHYPFENKDLTEKSFPADFIAEGLDQTRGWFYTLNVISAALFNKPAFKNVIVNGIILAEDGTKMSKRLKNYPEPSEVINKYGADAIRLYMLNSPAVKAEDLCFCKNGVELILRQALIPLWNSFYFLSTYAKIYHWKVEKKDFDTPEATIDRWILSLLNKLILDVEEGMDEYKLYTVVEPFVQFIDQLTNWYIRRSRQRFWADEDSLDRRQAFETLYTVILTISKIAAPFIPFITEEIYQQLRIDDMEESVHLCFYPKYKKEKRDLSLEEEMKYVQKAVSIGHALRKEHKIKVRQPLKTATIVAGDDKILKCLEKQSHLIEEELNVKAIEYSTDETQFVELIAKPNFRVLGKKIGKRIKQAQKIIESFSISEIKSLMKNKSISITIDDEKIELLQEDITVERKVKDDIAAGNDDEIAVVLDTKLNEELLLEGLAREIVNKINIMRKEKDFEVTDRINVYMQASDRVKTCYEKHQGYISNEILSLSFNFEKCDGSILNLNEEKVTLKIEKAN